MKTKSILDCLERLTDDALDDGAWKDCDFFQELTEVCLSHKDKVSRRCLLRLAARLVMEHP